MSQAHYPISYLPFVVFAEFNIVRMLRFGCGNLCEALSTVEEREFGACGRALPLTAVRLLARASLCRETLGLSAKAVQRRLC